MDKRLYSIFKLIEPGRGVIDVGTDHGYIPLALAESGYSGNIIASDINEGPLNAAKHTSEKYGYADRISFTLCPGLEKCGPDLVDTVVIAGMGGDMICGILDKAEWTMSKDIHLILQPMTRSEILRYWLSYNGYEHKSRYVTDGRFDYQIISAHFTGKNTQITDAELYTGLFSDLVEYNNSVRLVHTQIERFRKELSGLTASKHYVPERLVFLNSILIQLEAMESKLNDNRI